MIKLGLIGCGMMGSHYTKAFNRSGRAEISCCADPTPEKLSVFTAAHSIPNGYLDYQELLDRENLDGLLVAVPDFLHSAVSKACIERKIPVFCEKPLARTFEAAAELAQAADRKKVCTAVNFSKRNTAAVHAAKKLISEGALGAITHIDTGYHQGWVNTKEFGDWEQDHAWTWRLSNAHSTFGVLGDLGVHVFDLITLLSGPIDTLSCSLSTIPKGAAAIGPYPIDSPDLALIRGRLKSSATFTMNLSRIHTGIKDRCFLEIYGSEGSLRIDLEKNRNSVEFFSLTEPASGWQTYTGEKPLTLYEQFIEQVSGLSRSADLPDFNRGCEIQHILQRCAAVSCCKE